jgi:hypothetical protein
MCVSDRSDVAGHCGVCVCVCVRPASCSGRRRACRCRTARSRSSATTSMVCAGADVPPGAGRRTLTCALLLCLCPRTEAAKARLVIDYHMFRVPVPAGTSPSATPSAVSSRTPSAGDGGGGGVGSDVAGAAAEVLYAQPESPQLDHLRADADADVDGEVPGTSNGSGSDDGAGPAALGEDMAAPPSPAAPAGSPSTDVGWRGADAETTPTKTGFLARLRTPKPSVGGGWSSGTRHVTDGAQCPRTPRSRRTCSTRRRRSAVRVRWRCWPRMAPTASTTRYSGASGSS